MVDTLANKDSDLKKGDVFVSLNGKELKYFDQLDANLVGLHGKTVEAELLRDGTTISRTLNVDENGKLGIISGGTYSDIEKLDYYTFIRKEYNFGESIGVGLTRFKDQISSYWTQLKLIFTPSTGGYYRFQLRIKRAKVWINKHSNPFY